MSRFRPGSAAGKTGTAQEPAAAPQRSDSAALAEEIGFAALALAQRANAAGLTAVSFLLECAALEAGTQSVTRRWPKGPPER